MSGGLCRDVSVKKFPPNTDLSSRLVPMHAHDLKNNMWTLDDKSGIPGVVSDLKMSKTGKHGHAKFTYKLRMPFSGRASSLMHPGGDHLYRPVMEKAEYLVSHMDGEDDLICFNDDYEEIFFKIDPNREIFQKVEDAIEKGQNEGKDVYVTVLEGPMKVGNKDIEVLQQVSDVKLVAPKDN